MVFWEQAGSLMDSDWNHPNQPLLFVVSEGTSERTGGQALRDKSPYGPFNYGSPAFKEGIIEVSSCLLGSFGYIPVSPKTDLPPLNRYRVYRPTPPVSASVTKRAKTRSACVPTCPAAWRNGRDPSVRPAKKCGSGPGSTVHFSHSNGSLMFFPRDPVVPSQVR